MYLLHRAVQRTSILFEADQDGVEAAPFCPFPVGAFGGHFPQIQRADLEEEGQPDALEYGENCGHAR